MAPQFDFLLSMQTDLRGHRPTDRKWPKADGPLTGACTKNGHEHLRGLRRLVLAGSGRAASVLTIRNRERDPSAVARKQQSHCGCEPRVGMVAACQQSKSPISSITLRRHAARSFQRWTGLMYRGVTMSNMTIGIASPSRSLRRWLQNLVPSPQLVNLA